MLHLHKKLHSREAR